MNFVSLLGISAAILTTISLLPQVLKTIKTKKTKDISLGMYTIYCLGLLLWLIYGFLINDLPLILANSITFLLSLCILVLKIKFG
jgi:MtN3 and saliva related transmembrane protein